MRKLAIGDHVTCRVPEKAYYSGYGGLPEQDFEPGMVGVVARLNVPSVRDSYTYDAHGRKHRVPGHSTFTCVDFSANGREWRCGLFNDNIVRLPYAHH